MAIAASQKVSKGTIEKKGEGRKYILGSFNFLLGQTD
jgi:hypothetical protein